MVVSGPVICLHGTVCLCPCPCWDQGLGRAAESIPEERIEMFVKNVHALRVCCAPPPQPQVTDTVLETVKEIEPYEDPQQV